MKYLRMLVPAALATLAGCQSQPPVLPDAETAAPHYYSANPQQVLEASRAIFQKEFPDGFHEGVDASALTVIHPHTQGYLWGGSTGEDYRRVFIRPQADGSTAVVLNALWREAGQPGESVIYPPSPAQPPSTPGWNNLYGFQEKPAYYRHFFEQLGAQLDLLPREGHANPPSAGSAAVAD